MSTIDPRTPVVVGTGQVAHRPPRGEVTEQSPLDLMVEASRAAVADAGTGGEALLRRTESVGVVDVFCWPTPDPAALLARELGIAPRETLRTVIGGNSPIALLADVATRIAAGELEVALIGGGEVGTAFRRAMTSGEPTGWEIQPEGTAPTRVLGDDRPPSLQAELDAGLAFPVSYYPLFEHRLRHAAGRSTEEQRRWIGSWWARYGALAAAHPQGWIADAPTAEDLATPSPRNRLISDPYTRFMNADIGVDQAAMLLVTSAGAAEAAGVPRDRWVFLHGTAAASDHWFVGEREHLDRSPAIGASGRALFGHAGIAADDIALVDLYSCFPCAVQVGADELGFVVDDPDRPLSVTGGLALFGGPANNYVTHALATLVDRARERPEERALSSAVGWYLTKHGLALLSGTPPTTPYAHADVQAEVDATPRRTVAETPSGTWTLETFTVAYDRDGSPTVGSAVALDDDGRRGFGRSEDPDVLGRLLAADPIDRPVELDGAGGFAL